MTVLRRAEELRGQQPCQVVTFPTPVAPSGVFRGVAFALLIELLVGAAFGGYAWLAGRALDREWAGERARDAAIVEQMVDR